jgi:hypothetical protein
MTETPQQIITRTNIIYDTMTLRDYFAGQVLAGQLASSSTPFDIFVARYAYRIADIMLEARGE